jgi:UDP-N-acetylglucosamine 2-epimerase (non-hydrolysing)
MKRVAFVFGTRPEAIKLAPLVLKMRSVDDIECRVCVTAQHREMLDDVLRTFDIRPDADLDLMETDQTPAAFTARAVAALDELLEETRPDLLLIQGDTTTVLCAAIAAFYRRIPVGHVEAGLRTGDLEAPWPEEMNRQLTTRLTELHFAPTETARRNLLAEGVADDRIHVTGNTVVDALLLARERVRGEAHGVPGLPDDLANPGSTIPLVLVTSHRREHHGGGLQRIAEAVGRLAERFPRTAFVYPVHPNPHVSRTVNAILGATGRRGGNVHLIAPLSYLPFVALMQRCTLILTDSGGIQEEAPTLGKPVLVIRESTERPEAVDAGAARLVGTDVERIVEGVATLLERPSEYEAMARVRNPFGDGRAAERILEVTRRRLGLARPVG